MKVECPICLETVSEAEMEEYKGEKMCQCCLSETIEREEIEKYWREEERGYHDEIN